MEAFRRLVQIAFRNIFRNKRRSLLTLMILVLGSTGLMLVGGFFDDITAGLSEQFIHSQTGHIQVNVEGYYDKGTSAPFQYLMQNVSQIQQKIELQPHVLFTVPHLKFGGMASSNDTSIAVLALGVDPVSEQKMGSHQYRDAKQSSIHIVEGNNLDASDPYGAVLGKGLMKALGLKIGDSFNFITTRQAGAIDGAEYHVRGSFETIFKEFDDRAIKVNLESAQKILNTPDQVHSLLVILDETQNTSLVASNLDSQFRNDGLKLEVLPWEQQASFCKNAKALLDKIYTVIQFIISVIFFFSIANTINMAVFERMREFGTMMAIGNNRTTVFSTIFMEAFFLGIMGAALGIVIGSCISLIVSSVGIEMPPPPNGTNGYYAMIALSPRLLFQTFLIAAVSTLFSSLFPGHRACHMRIIQALGYV